MSSSHTSYMYKGKMFVYLRWLINPFHLTSSGVKIIQDLSCITVYYTQLFLISTHACYLGINVLEELLK